MSSETLKRAAGEALKHAPYTLEAIRRASASVLLNNLVSVTKSRTAYAIHQVAREIPVSSGRGRC